MDEARKEKRSSRSGFSLLSFFPCFALKTVFFFLSLSLDLLALTSLPLHLFPLSQLHTHISPSRTSPSSRTALPPEASPPSATPAASPRRGPPERRSLPSAPP